jgi:RNA polymerase sigma-70 factor (ECF subfamily)
MRSPISQDDLQILRHEADVAARRLVRQLRLLHADLDDVRQDLLVDLITRLPAYDRERGTLGAFAGIVLAHRATRIANRVTRERRMYGAVPISLDEAIPQSDGLTRGDFIAEADGLSALLGQPVDAVAAAECRLDVERCLGSLDPADGALCAALSRTTVHRLAANGHGARSSLYRRVRDISLALTAIGMRAAWDGSASA